MTGAHSRNKGKRFEVDVANWLKSIGVVHAERRGVHTDDRGDIDGIPGCVIECKNVNSPIQPAWLDQAEAARRHVGADLAVVIAKRKGHANAADALAIISMQSLATLLTESGRVTS